jgi:putative membrane protein
MKNLAKHFLSKSEQEQVKSAVRLAESQTAGEIVCMIISASYTYPMANILGAATFSLPLAILATHLLGGWLWLGTQNMWLFLGLFSLLFIAFYSMVARLPGLKRLFIASKEINEEVEEAAVTNFFREGLYRTQDANGVLVFISVFEQKIHVLADQGIHAKVPAQQWNDVVNQISKGIRNHRRGEAICEAVNTIGKLLATYFPIKPDDKNELRNLIISEP